MKWSTHQAFLRMPMQGLQQLLQLEIPADSVGLAQALEVAGWFLCASPGGEGKDMVTPTGCQSTALKAFKKVNSKSKFS